MSLENWAKSWSPGSGGTPADVAAQYHPDAVRYDRELRTEGRHGVTAFADGFMRAAPDAVLEVRTRVDQGSTVVIEWVWHGTHTGDVEGWPATGEKFMLEGCNVFQVEDGRIREERSYWDWEQLRRA